MAAPVVLRIKLRYEDVETLVQRFAANVGTSGLFLPTKSIQPIDTEIKFELRLATDVPVLVGLGKVRSTRDPDPAAPKAAFGMAVELVRVTREGREVILRMLERRRVLGLAELALPTAADVDAARRIESEHTSVRDTQTAARELPPEPAVPPAGDALLTAPRRGVGAIGVSKREAPGSALPALPPEPPRRARPRVSEVIARAQGQSGASVAAPGPAALGLDEHVDVERAMARARVLAAVAGDLDAELAALREAAAAPLVEISVEAASAELARQLGGAPVRRDRSAGWARPPAIARAVPAMDVGPVTMPVQAIEVEIASAPVVVAPVVVAPVVEAPPPAPAPVLAPPAAPEAPAAPELEVPAGSLIYDDADPAMLMRAVSSHDAPADVAPDADVVERIVEPADDLAEEVLDAIDVDELAAPRDDAGEHTQIGVSAVAPAEPEAQDGDELADALAAPLDDGEPAAVSAGLADRLDEELAEAEAEAAAEDADFAAPSAAAPDEAEIAEEIEDEIAQAIADDDIEEIDDFEILAEADADDADLLASDGEADARPVPWSAEDGGDLSAVDLSARRRASTKRAVRLPGMTPAPGVRISERRPTVMPAGDFDYSALDLDEEARAESAYPVVPESAEDAGFDRPASHPSELAEALDEIHAFDAPSYRERALAVEPLVDIPIVPPLTPARAKSPTGAPIATPPARTTASRRAERAGYDLEAALDDLDDLEPSPAPAPAPGKAALRAHSEGDGVLIDFDEDVEEI